MMGIIMLKVGRIEGWVFWELWPSYFGGGPSGEELFLRWCLVRGGGLFLTRANPRRAIAKTIFNHTARAWFLPGPVHTCCFVGWGFRGPVNAFPDYFNKLFLIILPHSNLLQTIKIVPFLHSRVVPNFSKCSPR